MLGTKINKNHLNIPLKTTLKTMLQLRSMSEPAWLDFGKVLDLQIHQKSIQNRSKYHPKNDHKNDDLLDGLKIDFYSILGAILGPKRRNRSLHFGYFWILGLSWGQDVPKTPPRASRDLSRPPPGPIFEALGPQLDGFWIDF